MKSSKFSFYTKDILNYRTELYGIATVLILIWHIARSTWLPELRILAKDDIFYSYLINYIKDFRTGVDMFVFFSPIGLYHSMQKNSTKQFYINRIKRLVIPCLVILIPYFLWLNILYRPDSVILRYTSAIPFGGPIKRELMVLFFDLTTASYWIPKMDYSFWYISFSFISYILYPLFYHLDKKTKHITTIIFFLAGIFLLIYTNETKDTYLWQIETLTSRIYLFFLGMLVSPLFAKKHKIPLWLMPILFVLWGVAAWQLLVWGGDRYFRFLGAAFAILSIFVFSFLMKLGKDVMYKLNRPFRFIGKYSLEVYVLHLVAFNIINALEELAPTWSRLPGTLWMIVILLICLFIGQEVQTVSKYISNKLFRRVKSASNN